MINLRFRRLLCCVNYPERDNYSEKWCHNYKMIFSWSMWKEATNGYQKSKCVNEELQRPQGKKHISKSEVERNLLKLLV